MSCTKRDWFFCLILAVATMLAYQPAWHAGFIWDDDWHLTQNPCIVGPLGLKEVWTSTRAVYYPLVLTTFWALHKFVGLWPLPYHILNVLMHAGSALLLWRVLRQLDVRGAWLGAALWALHPVMVQSVAWITELKNTQSCLFYLLSAFFFLNWEEQAWAARMARIKSTLMLGLSLGCFVLATLSKPSVVMLPAVLALCIWWRRGRIGWQYTLSLAPFLFISALASAWTIWEQKFHASAVGPDWSQTWPERLIIAGRAIWFYLAKLFWPHPLIFIYPRWEIHLSQLIAYVPLLAATVGLVLLWLLPGKAGRALFFAAAYYVISLFPVLGFFNVYFFRYSFVSDHFQYLASMGPLALAGAGIAILLGRFCKTPLDLASDTDALQSSGNNTAIVRRKLFLSSAACSLLLLLLGILTWQQTAVYHDLISLYTKTLARNPACWMAYNNLGFVLYQANRIPEAMDLFKQSLRINPDNAEAYTNLGNTLLQTGRTLEAIDQYKQALRINPNDVHAHNSLGNALVQTGQTSEAMDEFNQALLIDPDFAEAHNNLGNTLLETGRTFEAIDQYKQALRINPNYADARNNLGAVLGEIGRISEAIEQFKAALRINPNDIFAQNNLTKLQALQENTPAKK